MTRHQSFFAYLALLVGVACFASSFAGRSSGQQGATAPAVGRYQHSVNHESSLIFITDTSTGQTWARGLRTDSKWMDLGPPGAR